MRSLTHLAGALLLGTAISVGAGVGAGRAQTVQLTYAQPLSSGAVQTVQERLRQFGDYPGAIDGNWGPDSVAALQRFQQMHGLQPTGELNQATVASLGLDPGALLGTPALAATPPAPPVAPAYTAALSAHSIGVVQAQLRRLGYYRGNIDGVWGPATQDAIVGFQQGRGLQPNGQLNPATVEALGLNPNYIFAAR